MLPSSQSTITFLFAFFAVGAFSQTSDRLPDNYEVLYLNASTIGGVDGVARAELERASKHTGVEFAMVITSAIPEYLSIEDYAATLFKEWRLGESFGGKGILFLFDTSNGALKIEATYEIEPLFPKEFIEQVEGSWKDYYADAYFGDCFSSIILSFMQVLQGKEVTEVWPIIEDSLDNAFNDFVSGGDIQRVLGFKESVTEKRNRIKLLTEEERSKFDKSSSIEVVFERYVTSLKLGYNDPFLGLLTEGSQYMRLEYPKGPSFQKRAAKEFGGPHQIYQQGDLAAIRFEDPLVTALYLRRDAKGYWQFDITKSWAYAQANSELTKFYPTFSDIPWMFAWPEFREIPNYPRTPALMPLETNLEERIDRLERLIASDPDNPRHYFELGDLLYFECYWIRNAIDIIEIGLSKNPADTAYHYRALTMRYRYPDHRNILSLRKQIFEIDPGDSDNRKELLTLAKESGKEAELVRKLENMDTGPIPEKPAILIANSGEQTRSKYRIENGSKTLSFDLTMLRANRHPDKRSFVYFLIKNDARRGNRGEVFEFGPEGENWIYCSPFANNEEGHANIVTLNASGTIKITFDWSTPDTLIVRCGDRVLNQMPLSFEPDVAFASSYSSDAIFTFNQ